MMGYWGMGPWENDSALDWRWELSQANSIAPIRDMMQSYLESSDENAWEVWDYSLPFAAADASLQLHNDVWDTYYYEGSYAELRQQLLEQSFAEQLRAIIDPLYSITEEDSEACEPIAEELEALLGPLGLWREALEATLMDHLFEKLELDPLDGFLADAREVLDDYHNANPFLDLNLSQADDAADILDRLTNGQLQELLDTSSHGLEVLAYHLDEPVGAPMLEMAYAVTTRLLSLIPPMSKQHDQEPHEDAMREITALHDNLRQAIASARG